METKRWSVVLSTLAVAAFLSGCGPTSKNNPERSQRLALVGASSGTPQAAPVSASSSVISCSARAIAVAGDTGTVTVQARSTVDSYHSGSGAYGGTNVGQNGAVSAGRVIVNNGGTINGKQIPNDPANLTVVPVPAGARPLPLGATKPGNVNINVASDSITLAPGAYVVANLNVNSPGKITISPAGQVSIWVTGSLNLGGTENQNGIPSNLTFLVTNTGFVNVNANGQLFGTIYAPLATVNVNSTIFGSVVGSAVALNSGAAVHFDQDSTCPAPTFASAPPRTLPAPPRHQGCYIGTLNGWAQVPCTSNAQLNKRFQHPDVGPAIDATSPATVPFQFGQVESTIVTIGKETDDFAGDNSLSLQANTNRFTATTGTAVDGSGSAKGHTGWVQLTIQSYDGQVDEPPSAPVSAICVWNNDLTVVASSSNSNGYTTTCIGGSIVQQGATYNVAKRAGPFKPLDFATIGGSTFVDDTGAASIGLVAQLSWWDPSSDPNNNQGLYSVVAQDSYGLAGQWTQIGGTLLGLGSGAHAIFTDSSVRTQILAGSCLGAGVASPAVPWPGVCPTEPLLLPNTALDTQHLTAEVNNLIQVGVPNTLAALTPDLVFTEYLASTSGTCMSSADRVFVRDTPEDTGAVPSNTGGQPFWQSPDIFLVPHGTTVDVNAQSNETLVTPGAQFDIYLRVNNDYGCDDVSGVKAQISLADPSALSVAWQGITTGGYVGDANDPNGITVKAGQRGLWGPFTFTAPTSGIGNGHKCILAAIDSANQPAVPPPGDSDAPDSFQVAQRNIQFGGLCDYPMTNGTVSDGQLQITLSVNGATPSTTGFPVVQVTFDDPNSLFLAAWTPGASSSTYQLTQPAAGKTVVRLGELGVKLAPVTFAAGQTSSAAESINIGPFDPTTTLTLGTLLIDASGKTLASNGGDCTQLPPPPGQPPR